MSDEDQEAFENRVEKLVRSILDAQLRKLVVATWVMIVSGLLGLVTVGVAWGSLKTEVAHNSTQDEKHQQDGNVHMTDTVKLNVFVTRAEWTAVMAQHNQSVNALQESIHRVEDKLDQVRQTP